MDIQAIFRDIDTNEALLHDPSLRMRSHCADRATVRVHRNDASGAPGSSTVLKTKTETASRSSPRPAS